MLLSLLIIFITYSFKYVLIYIYCASLELPMIWWSLLRMLEATRTISRDYLYTDEYIDRVVLLLCDDDVSNLTKIS